MEVKCQLHDIQFKEHLEKDVENQKAIRESLHEIRNAIQVLLNPTVRNGGGMMFSTTRQELDQKLYNSMKWKWKDTIKDITVVVSVITALASAVKAFIL